MYGFGKYSWTGLGAAASTSAIQAEITSEANQYGIPPSIALAVAKQESGYNQAAIGSSGEIGVFQLMPATAAGLKVNPSDLDQNIQGGVSLLSSLYGQYGNWPQALEAYNAGPGAVASGNIPSSTQSYVSSVMAQAGMLDSTEPVDTTDDSEVSDILGTLGPDFTTIALFALGGLAILLIAG